MYPEKQLKIAAAFLESLTKNKLITHPTVWKICNQALRAVLDELHEGAADSKMSVPGTVKFDRRIYTEESVHWDEDGFDQEAKMPNVPNPEMLLSLEDLREMRKTILGFPVNFDRTYRNKVATAKFVPWPIEIRFCEPNNATSHTKSPPRLAMLSAIRFPSANEAILQSASFNAIFMLVAAYASDLIFNTVNLNPHRRKGFKVWIIREFQQLLDHFVNVPALYYGKYVNVCRSSLYNFFVKWIWFHGPLRADDWILFVMHSPTAYNARGFVTGQMLIRKGEIVVSLTQEALLRPARKLPAFQPKL
ncbi:acyl-coenzyme A thioesterase 8-like [Solanum tuberosum]|uniref:acyl-coenzyme A thioesterase 8-like n=1 Tax=Solanum tuberosum TaxID=4113 RepID=UPI00073A313F|nr:PREDICTED: acyl-coenzyme A thioesterase 8-like [Solanum tuberosum]